MKNICNIQLSPSSPQNRPHTNHSRQRSITIKPRFKSSVKFKKIDCRFSDKKQLVDFTVVKELDEETNLHYYGARYLDPRTSRWIAGDPAIWQGDYIPVAPSNDEARKHNQNLPGMGGIFNMVNMHAYHYAGNNPVKYVDPDGEYAVPVGIFVLGAVILYVALVNNNANNRKAGNQSIFTPTYNSGNNILPSQRHGNRLQTALPPASSSASSASSAPSQPPQNDDENNNSRLRGEPGNINRQGNQATRIGEDGRANLERHYTDHGNPKAHTNPHDHNIEWMDNGEPRFGPPINYPNGAPPL